MKRFTVVIALVLVFSLTLGCFSAFADSSSVFDNLKPSKSSLCYGDSATPVFFNLSDVYWAAGISGSYSLPTSGTYYNNASTASKTFSYTDLKGPVQITYHLFDSGSSFDKGKYTLSGSVSVYGLVFNNSLAGNASASSTTVDVDLTTSERSILLFDGDDNYLGECEFVFTRVDTWVDGSELTSGCLLRVRYDFFWKCELSIDSLVVSKLIFSFDVRSYVTFNLALSSYSSFYKSTGARGWTNYLGITWTNNLNSSGDLDSSELGDIADSLAGLGGSLSDILRAISQNQYLLELIVSYLNGNSSADTLLRQMQTILQDTYDNGLAIYKLLLAMQRQDLILYDTVVQFQRLFIEFVSRQLEYDKEIVDDLLAIQLEIQTQGEAIRDLLKEIIAGFDGAFDGAGDAMNSTSGSLSDAEDSMLGSASSAGGFQIDSSASRAIGSVGTGGFTFIESVINLLFNCVPWLSTSVTVFLMVFIAKKTIT